MGGGGGTHIRVIFRAPQARFFLVSEGMSPWEILKFVLCKTSILAR